MISALARSNRSIVTTYTGADHFIVIHGIIGHRLPWRRPRLMTGIAVIGGIYVISAFTRSNHSIMTADTGTDDLVVINGAAIYRRPWCRSWLVTGITGIGAIDMIHALTRRHQTIVTTDTGAIHLRMVHHVSGDGRPQSWEFFVAGIAHVRSIYMIRSFTAGGYAVMTANTVIHKWRMINGRGYPLLRTMTVITFLRSGNVRWTFTGGDHVIMTAGTHAQYFSMINPALRYG